MTDDADDPDFVTTFTNVLDEQIEHHRKQTAEICDASVARANAAWELAHSHYTEAQATFERAIDRYRAARWYSVCGAIFFIVAAAAGVAIRVAVSSYPTRRVCVELPSPVQRWFGPTR